VENTDEQRLCKSDHRGVKNTWTVSKTLDKFKSDIIATLNVHLPRYITLGAVLRHSSLLQTELH
jgi:hypothetical protein